MINRKARDVALYHQLISIRSGIDAALSLLVEDEERREEDDGSCKHRNKIDISTMGGGNEKWKCQDCDEIHEGRIDGNTGS